jgi:hypothetical protein
LHLLNKILYCFTLGKYVCLVDVHERFGSWCESRPMGVYYTLASSKFMENFVTLNVALVAECGNYS